MPHRRLSTFPLLAALALLAFLVPGSALRAAPFGLFQHGGRALGQAGAFTARADEPSAVGYNPAGLAQLEGFQFQAGIDFSSANDSYSSEAGNFNLTHSIQIPPALYASWKAKESPWAFGFGLDSPVSHIEDWRPVFFPGRFLTRKFALRLFEAHPTVAYDLGDGWSVGGGIRYLKGTLGQGTNALITFVVPPTSSTPATNVPIEVQLDADSDVDGFSWDAAVQYKAPVWGWGAVFRDKVEVEGSGEAKYKARDVPGGVPGLDSLLAARLASGTAKQSFELPRELRSGIWYAPYPELRLELDGAFHQWSSVDETAIGLSRTPLGGATTLRTSRAWKDTVSLRLGVEGNLTDNFLLYGGVALEPSPVPQNRLEPGFPRQDTTVYALGASYSLDYLSFDVGYSYHDGGKFGVDGQEPLNPTRSGSYESTEAVWGFSVRWRL
jgi:long-chain fatty acid transport protein